MSIMVWIDDWQMQCCGDPFAVGAEVAWTLGEPPGQQWLESVCPGTQLTIDASEDHHDMIPADTVTRGTVRQILALHYRLEVRTVDGRPGRYPVPGTGALTELRSADGWTANRGEQQFQGYLVRLDPK